MYEHSSYLATFERQIAHTDGGQARAWRLAVVLGGGSVCAGHFPLQDPAPDRRAPPQRHEGLCPPARVCGASRACRAHRRAREGALPRAGGGHLRSPAVVRL